MSKDLLLRDINKIIYKIASTSSKNNKVAIIRTYMGSDRFVKVLKAALDPDITYGIAKKSLDKIQYCPVVAPTHVDDPDAFFELLYNLKYRHLTGAKAKAAIGMLLDKLSVDAGELLKKILLKKLRAGFTAESVNKAIPNTFKLFKFSSAQLFDERHIKRWPWRAEYKLDGIRMFAFIKYTKRGGTVWLSSKNGNQIRSCAHIERELAVQASRKCLNAPNGSISLILDGEVTDGSFNGTSSAIRKQQEQTPTAVFNVFDAIVMFNEYRIENPVGDYNFRRKLLKGFMNGMVKDGHVRQLKSFKVTNISELENLYDKALKKGYEGLIVKDPFSSYELKRTNSWLKMKPSESTETVVVGYEEGTGKNEGRLGKLFVLYQGKVIGVGTGLSDELRETLWHGCIRDSAKTGGTPDINYWGVLGHEGEVLGRVIEVQYQEITPDGSFRHPRFVKFRDILTGQME